MPTIRLPNGWQPRPYQRAAWDALERGRKRALLVWHRRAGKDDLILHRTSVAAHERVANYWHCLPRYEQARKAIWEAINPHTGKKRIDEAFPPAIRARTDNSSMVIELKCGSMWRVVGSDNPDSLVGAPPAGISFSEWAICNPSSWAYLAPILAENNGWATFITTPRGRNHVKTMYDMAKNNPEWFAQILRASDTGAVSQKTIEDQRIEYHSIYGIDEGDALIEQEYNCSFEGAILGAYYGREMLRCEQDNRIGIVPIESSVPVNTAWDLGKGDHMAIWCWQIVAGQIRIVDFLQGQRNFVPEYCDLLNERGYHGEDIVPHDAKVPELGSGKTRIETMISHKRTPVLCPDHRVDDGINAVRQTLPMCWFNESTTGPGCEALRQYSKQWDDDKKTFKDLPLHDWASHPADAFRYLAMAWKLVEQPAPPAPKPLFKQINQMTMDEYMATGNVATAGRRETL